MSEPASDSERPSLRRWIVRLHDEGWIVTLSLMALVLMGGMWSLWRASVQEEIVREMRAELIRVDDMLRERTSRFQAIERNQKSIMDDIAAMLADQNQKFAKILDHVRREEEQWKSR